MCNSEHISQGNSSIKRKDKNSRPTPEQLARNKQDLRRFKRAKYWSEPQVPSPQAQQ